MNLIITNLSKSYEENPILKDISLEIKRGEVFCIYGVLNVGKSVLLRTIAGIEKSESGSIYFNDIDLSDCSCDERGFHFPDLSNESFWKELFNTKKRSELGDGEGQVLAIEHTLKNAEGVLLLDNSFCQMDRKTRKKNYELIRNVVAKKNLIVLLATNDYEEVFQIADRVAILSDGRILQTGVPKEVYEKPNTKTIAEVFGDYNLIKAKLNKTKTIDLPEFITEVGEHKITTGNFEKNKVENVDASFTLAIRPQNISISFGASFPDDNLIKAVVTGIIFQGSTTAIKLNAKGLELEALVLRVVGLNVGDECMVGLPPDRILVFKD